MTATTDQFKHKGHHTYSRHHCVGPPPPTPKVGDVYFDASASKYWMFTDDAGWAKVAKRQVKGKSFRSGAGVPAATLEAPKVGDVHFDTVAKVYYIFYGNSGWKRAVDGENATELPLQRHPKYQNEICFVEGKWIHRRTLRGHLKAAGVRRRSPSVELVSPPPSKRARVVSPPPLPPTIEAPSLNVPPNANDFAVWVRSLRERWHTSPATLSQVQFEKGLRIFNALEQKGGDARRLTLDHPSGEACTLLGKPDRAGPPPTMSMLMVDLWCSNGDANTSDSITNLTEVNVRPAEVYQQQHDFLSGKPLLPGARLLVAFDIPATKDGMLRSQYGTGPFVAGKDAIISASSTTLAFPSTITYPHMDGVGCGMHIVHWAGQKLWLFWPPTESNLYKMRRTRTSVIDISGACELIQSLDGLEVAWFGEDDMAECAFILAPNTIHCCLTFTESSHYGASVRSVRFMPGVAELFRIDAEWMETVLWGMAIDDEEKGKIVEKFVEQMGYWIDLARVLPEGSPMQSNILSFIQRSWARVKCMAISFDVDGPDF
ncbi:hypothetical protein DFP72DRAFT_1058056 [Ephemerocybe angulata]|uniref:JmjC domain-containing protein n=1 Tax=Ephemerocybe angulata TaxID=980116 RepID=A0A8H6IJI8_9AGAR|nr:hypothetical protein DFP72DRAFT_1058056 [Tulosesus angulatus]